MWQTTTKLMSHQADAVAKLLPLRVGALFMEMGTGKTRTVFELAKFRQQKINRMVWFCPVSVKYTIAKEVAKHTTLAQDNVLVFNDRTNADTKDLLNKAVVIVGIESMASSDRVMLAVQSLIDDKTMVVLDEATYIKNHRAKRTRRIEILSRKARYRLILTGTAMTQGAVDLYAQMQFLSPKILGYVGFYEFAERHLVFDEVKLSNGRKIKTKRVVNELETEILAEKIAPYSYQITKQECLDLPKKLHTSYAFCLTDEQAQAYSKAKELFVERLLVEEYDWGSSIPIFQLFTDLQGIVCGFWRTKDQVIELKHERIDTMMDVLYGLEKHEKVVIWGKYHYCIHQITQALMDEFGHQSTYQYHGKMSEKQRKNSLMDWQYKGRFIVATQSAGGHGLNEMVSASHAVFYANSFKYSERLQAEDRIHRIGQSKPCWYADIYAVNSIDVRISDNLDTKGHTLKVFMDKMNEIRKLGLKDGLVNMIKGL